MVEDGFGGSIQSRQLTDLGSSKFNAALDVPPQGFCQLPT